MDREKMGLSEAARFNEAMDTNQRLNNGLLKLTKRLGELTETEYTDEMLSLFRDAGLDLTSEQLRTLLKLRLKTEQMLLQGKRKTEMRGDSEK